MLVIELLYTLINYCGSIFKDFIHIFVITHWFHCNYWYRIHCKQKYIIVCIYLYTNEYNWIYI